MRGEHRQFGVRQDMAGGAAEDQLPQPALCIGALDDEVAAECAGAVEYHRPGGASDPEGAASIATTFGTATRTAKPSM